MPSTGFFARIPIWLFGFLVITSLRILPIQAKSSHSNLEANEVAYNINERSEPTTLCLNDAICGYLQANVRGINRQKLCSCPAGYSSSCPMAWDPVDGHSITQGSDQYKFCGAAPAVPVCESGYTAYTSRMVFSKETEETLDKSDNVHCICPEGSNYVMAHQHFEDLSADTEMMVVTYTCALLPECGVGDYCKAITEKSSEYLVSRKCQCPNGFRCPTLSESGVKTIPMGSGIIHYIRCQR